MDKLQQWTILTAEERNACWRCRAGRDARAGKYVVREGDRVRTAPAHPRFAFRQKLIADGGRSISAIHMRGDVLDLQIPA